MANAISLSDVIGPVGKIKTGIEHIDANITDITRLLYGISNSIAISNQQNEKNKESYTKSNAISDMIGKTGKVKDEKLEVLNKIDFKFGELLDMISGKSNKLKKGKESGGKSKLNGYSSSIKEIAEAVAELGLLGPIKAMLFSATISIIEEPIGKMLEMFDNKTRNIDAKIVKENAEALDITAGAILKFCGSMALTALLAVPAAIGALAAIPLVWVSVKLMNMLSDVNEDAQEGAKTLGIFSVSLLGFTASLALTVLIVSAVINSDKFTLESVLGSVGVFVLIGATMFLFKLVDDFSEDSLKGAFVIGALGVSLLVFTGGLVLSTMIIGSFMKTDDFSFGSVLGTVAIFALAFATLKIFNKFASKDGEEALKGAFVIGALGVSLLVFTGCFALSAMIVSNFIKSDDFSVGSLLGTVAIFALAIATKKCLSSIGKDWKNILKGVGAVAAMGIGMLVFGFGFGKAVEYIQPIEWKDLGKTAAVVAGLAIEFGVAGLAAVPIALGAAAMAGVGGSLYLIGEGINQFNEAIGDEDSIIKLLGKRTDKGFEVKQGLMYGIINSVFGIFGDSDVFKKLRSSRKGLKASRKLTEILSGLAVGIGTFADLESRGIPDKWDKNGNPISYRPFDLQATTDAIVKILNTIPDVFGKIGETVGNDGGFSFFGKTNLVEKGIKSVRGIGEILSSIATGVASFGLIYSKGIPIFSKDGDKIIEWVPFNQDALINGLVGTEDKPGILTALSSAFAKVGSMGKEVSVPNGTLGLGGQSIMVAGNSKNVLRGIITASGMSSVLVNIATAVNSFANVETMKDANGAKINIASITENVKQILTTLPNAFNSIKWDDLKKANSRAEYFKDEDSPLVKALNNISSVIPNFSKTIDPQNIKTMTDAVRSVGGALSTVPDTSENGRSYGDLIFNQMPKLTDFATKGADKISETLEKTKNTINAIDLDKVNGLAGMYKAMSELSKIKKNEFDILTKRITEAAEKIVEAVIEAGGGSKSEKEKLPSEPKVDKTSKPQQNITVATTKQQPIQQQQAQEIRIYLNDIEGFGNGFTVIPR